jgi:jumonji domain-containing protein 7
MNSYSKWVKQKDDDRQADIVHDSNNFSSNRYADAVTYDPVTDKEYFTMPHEERMTFNSFLDLVEGNTVSENANYISLQNGSLPMEYSAIEKDVDQDIDWCSQALGKKPDAVNFWFGDEKSITSLHKDPYENCYAVIRGQKTFILYPPTEYYCMHGKAYFVNKKIRGYS